MKPLKLTMQAFGSYGKKTTIDFEEPNQNLFLITGDTGAGKTTIFDAVVFALYGEASSTANKKNGIALQSQFARLDVEPFVELTFSDGYGTDCDIYKVTRIPRHLKLITRKTAKGSGTREIGSSVTLIMPNGTEYPQKEVDMKLEEIVGLTKEQFMQVAMIAQGEFMEILREKSDKKKEIFRKLFNTKLFQDIVDELQRRTREKTKDIAVIKTECQTVAGRVILPEQYGNLDVLNDLKSRVVNGEIAVIGAFSQELQILCEQLEADMEKAGQEYSETEKLRDKKRDAYTNAEHVLKFFVQLDKAEHDLAECKEKETEIRDTGVLIAQLCGAYEIQTEYQRYIDAEQRVAATQTALEQQEKLLPKLIDDLEKAAREEDSYKKQYENELEAHSKISEKVKNALSLFEKIEEEKKKVEQNSKDLNSAKKNAEDVKKEKADLELQAENWKNQMEELKDTDIQQAVWENASKEKSALEEQAEGLLKLQKEIGNQQIKAEQSRTKYINIKEKYSSKNNEYESKRQAFLDAQAGFLARELEVGKPCPVCGSLEHPSPCGWKEEYAELSETAINELGKEVEELRLCQENLAAEAQSDTTLLNEKQTSFREGLEKLHQRMKQSIGDVPEALSLEEDRKCIEDWNLSLEAQGRQLTENIQRQTQIQESLQNLDEMRNQINIREGEAVERETEAKVALASSEAALQNLEAAKEYPTKGDAQGALQQAEQNKEKQKFAYNTAVKMAAESKSNKDNCETLIRKYTEELPEQEEQCRQGKTAYETAMQQRKLSEAEWKELTENYERADLDTLQEKVNAYQRNLTSAENLKKSATEAIGRQKRPVLEDLQKEMDEAEEKREHVKRIYENLKKLYETDRQVYEELIPRMDNRQKIVAEHAKLEGLYQLMSGNVSGSRMDIETYVQRYYLEKILYAANRRFQDMSAGQYELRLIDLEKAGEGKNKGLDLMVFSHVTGKEREVRTLSGGESFMAALALALGMADQIQENSAAINLDIMFIDEGFGSLDEHSRNQAVKVLLEMAEGSKLIGIISHVTELKQQIDNQLLVHKDENGSFVKWQIS